MKTRPIQYFDPEYLEMCQQMSSTEILQFLDDYRKLHLEPGELTQINVRVPKNVLTAFKARAKREGMQYQRKLKDLMAQWALE